MSRLGWSYPEDVAALIAEEDQRHLIERGLKPEHICALGQIIVDAHAMLAVYSAPPDVREAIKEIDAKLSPLHAVLHKCPEWAATVIEMASHRQKPGLKPIVIRDVASVLSNLKAALAEASQLKAVTTPHTGKADVGRSVSTMVENCMARAGFPKRHRATGQALDVVLRTAGIPFKHPRQYLKSEKRGRN